LKDTRVGLNRKNVYGNDKSEKTLGHMEAARWDEASRKPRMTKDDKGNTQLCPLVINDRDITYILDLE